VVEPIAITTNHHLPNHHLPSYHLTSYHLPPTHPMKPAIRVENLGKRYRVNHAAPRGHYRTLRESLTDAATAPLRRFRNGGNAGSTEDFWALKDVNFEVQPGEVVGIIGRNGAGKSTLLKVLSRITEPTRGEVRINGRIGSLLEVGTGFHQELSGRENVFLNGSILGMSKGEISTKFEEIVDFSGISRFIDTPVKRYSSGMQVRLAFAVAAHLDTNILIVDEVLAVGDVDFQERCLGKMQDISRDGRTVLLVTHNTGAVSRLCSRAICFRAGRIRVDGDVDHALQEYVGASHGEGGLVDRGVALELSLFGSDGIPMRAWRYGETLAVNVKISTEELLTDPAIDLAFYSDNGTRIFSVQSDQILQRQLDSTSPTLQFEIRNPGLACNYLTIDVGLRTKTTSDYRASWQRASTIPVSHEGLPKQSKSESLLSLPCTINAA